MYRLINWYTRHFPFPKRGMKYMLRFLQICRLIDKKFVKKLHTKQLLLVSPDEHIQRMIFYYGFYEREVILTLEKFLPATVFIDIGANIGYYSIIAAKSALHVYAFEPAKRSILSLKENIILNKLKNITILPYAVASVSKEQLLYLSDDSNTGMNSLIAPENDSGETEIVKTIVFDEWYNQAVINGQLCIKIDAEGSEMEILQGMHQTINWAKPIFFIEVQEQHLTRFGHKPANIFDFFKNHNYEPYKIESACVLRKISEPIDADSIVFLPVGHALPNGISFLSL